MKLNAIERAIEYIKDPIGKSYKQYEEYEHLAKAALEKQIPKKTITFINKEDIKVGRLTFKPGCTVHKCPVCETIISYDKYCRNCGQLLERSKP